MLLMRYHCIHQLSSPSSSTLHNPLLPQPPKNLQLPLLNQPLPTRPGYTHSSLHKPQLIAIQAMCSDLLPLPIHSKLSEERKNRHGGTAGKSSSLDIPSPLPKMYSRKIRRRTGSLAIGRDFDMLRREGVLRCHGRQSTISQKKGHPPFATSI